MNGTREISGILLAGGASSRFGSDKLAATIEGRTLLQRAADALTAVCGELIVVVGRDAARRVEGLPPEARVVRDREAFAGPRAGLLAGVAASSSPIAIVLGADMPWARPALLALLAERLADEAAADAGDATCPAGAVAPLRDGRLCPLPCAIRVSAVRTASVEPHGSLLALLEQVRVVPLAESEWRAVDPTGASLRDVDRPGDLAGPRGRPAGETSQALLSPRSRH